MCLEVKREGIPTLGGPVCMQVGNGPPAGDTQKQFKHGFMNHGSTTRLNGVVHEFIDFLFVLEVSPPTPDRVSDESFSTVAIPDLIPPLGDFRVRLV